jgi:tight adherence protein B
MMFSLIRPDLIVYATTFIGVTIFVAVGLWHALKRRPDRTQERFSLVLETLRDTKQPRSLMKEDGFSLSSLFGGGSALGTWLLGWSNRLRLVYEQAGLPVSAAAFIGFSVALTAGSMILAVLLELPPYLQPLIAMAGVLLPWRVVVQCRMRRQRVLSSQLPDALELIARAIRAGNGLGVGIRAAADELLPPIALEFRRVCDTHSLGLPIEDALANMIERVPDHSLKFFSTAVAMHRKYGGNLAEVLDKISHIVRDRFKVLGQVSALTAEGRLSGVVLMALPLLMFAAIYVLNKEYVMVLFTEPLGQQMLAGAIGLQFLGAWSIRYIVQIEV